MVDFSLIKQKPLFWEIKLNLSLKGRYSLHQAIQTIEGNFHGHFRWLGLIEPDEPDVILFQWQSEVISWEMVEKEKRKNQEIGTFHSTFAPKLKVEAFIRQDDAFWLDFFLEGLSIPFSQPEPEQKLILPSSFIKDQIINDLRYNDHLKAGSNKIFIPLKEMNQPEYRQNFSWKWSYPPDYSILSSIKSGTEHEVQGELFIKAHFKK
ncbi:MAG: hypothetical protein N3B16_03050 [Candidatus Aminicenantes bacterium]|nr:hypothetical protein [Candidatus Aminicenantes bacterium]